MIGLFSHWENLEKLMKVAVGISRNTVSWVAFEREIVIQLLMGNCLIINERKKYEGRNVIQNKKVCFLLSGIIISIPAG